MSKRLFATALVALVVAACGDDGAITEPRATGKKITALAAIGTDPTTGATIETNQDDYLPGQIIHLVGRGWTPGETVSLFMTEEPDTHADVSMDVQADSTGTFDTRFYGVQEYDFGVVFTLTATGRTSGSVATAVFTDGRVVTSATINGLAPGSTINATANQSLTFVVGGFTDNTGANTRWASTLVTYTPNPTGTGATVCNDIDVNNSTTVPASNLSVTFAGAAPAVAGTYKVTFQAYQGDACSGAGNASLPFPGTSDAQFTLVVSAAPSNTPPNVTAGGPYAGDEGAAISITGTASDGDGTVTSTAWSVASTTPSGVSCSFADASALSTTVTCNDNAAVTLTLTATDDDGATNSANATVTVSNVAPTIGTYTPGGNANEGTTIAFSISGITDPSSADATAGFEYAFACDGANFDSYGTSTSVNCAAGDGPGSVTIAAKAKDKDGGESVVVSSTFTIVNVAPSITSATTNSPVAEGSNATMSVTGVSDAWPADLVGATYAFACDGVTFGAFGTSSSVSCPTTDGPGSVTIAAKVKDKDGGVSAAFTQNVTVSNVAPTLNSVAGSAAPVAVNTSTSVTFDFSDPAGTYDTYTAAVNWGDATTSTGAVTPNGSLSHTYMAAGVYTVCATVSDEDGGTSAQKCYMYVVVYDPSAGFVTGGGWINSPAGAYVADPTLTGKATFGFVSKYKKGATAPDGNTEFQFHTANMNFKSTAYEWLVVSGARGQFKGTGTINGAGNYGFLLTAIDGQVNGGGNVDKFRIKIWDKNNGDAVVYDNQIGSLDTSDTAVPTTTLGGGSINIQAK